MTPRGQLPDVPHAEGRAARLVVSESDLLAATRCADLDELSALVDGDCDADMWVTGIDGGVEIGSGVWATCLEFPFSLTEFWAVVGEVENDEVDRIVASDVVIPFPRVRT